MTTRAALRSPTGGFVRSALGVRERAASDLVAVGAFTASGATTMRSVAKWNGSAWVAMGYTLADAHYFVYRAEGDLLMCDGGVRRYDSGGWSVIGPGANSGRCYCMAVYGGALHVCGEMVTIGGVSVGRIARWSGSAWEAIDPYGLDADAFNMVRYNGALVLGGAFNLAGNEPTGGVAAWDGAAWSRVGDLRATDAEGDPLSPVTTAPLKVCVHQGVLFALGPSVVQNQDVEDVGPVIQLLGGAWYPVSQSAAKALHIRLTQEQGPQIMSFGDDLVCAAMDPSGSPRYARVCAWDGDDWRQIGGDFSHSPTGVAQIFSLGQYRGSLVAGGVFDLVDGNSASNIARFSIDSGEWEPMGDGLNASVYCVRELTPPLVF